MNQPDDSDTPGVADPLEAAGALQEARACFERGDYARAGELLDALDERTLDEEQRRAYEDLKRKLEPDPLGVKLALFGMLLFVAVTVLVLVV